MFIIGSTSTSTWLFLNNNSSSSPLFLSCCIDSVVNGSFALPKLERRSKCRAVDGGGEKQSVTTVAATTTSNFDDDNDVVDSASAVVRNFYGGINAHDVDSVEYLIADKCVYEDLVFPRPFVGRKEILEFFKKFTNSTSKDLQFVIDDLSTEDSSSVGNGREKLFPLAKGAVFLSSRGGQWQKTNNAAIRSVTWLLQQFPQLASWL